MSHGHSANNSMDTKANQPSEHQGAAVDVGSGPLLGVYREWWVVSTCLSTRELMLECSITNAFGVVQNPTKEEWRAAFHAPSEPYRWHDESRVVVNRDLPSA